LSAKCCLNYPLEQHYLFLIGILLPREKLGAILCIKFSIPEGLTGDAAFDCFGFFGSRLLLF
jgi:hypothetical protein